MRKYPENWSELDENEKQKFYDEIREKIHKKYNKKNSEKSIILVSAAGILKNYEDSEKGKTLIEIAEKNMNQKVIGDAKNRSRKQYLEDNFTNVTGNTIIDTELRKYIVSKITLESLFNNESVSSTGAIGIMQLMPSMINIPIVNPKNKSIDEVKLSLPLQVELARNLTNANYQNLSKYTNSIARAYYNGDTEKAEKDFIFPALINSYNTGTTTIMKNLDNFMKKYPDQKSLMKVSHTKYDGNMGMDVFNVFTDFCLKSNATGSYGTAAWGYTYKTFGMNIALSGKADTSKLDEDYDDILEEKEVPESSE